MFPLLNGILLALWYGLVMADVTGGSGRGKKSECYALTIGPEP